MLACASDLLILYLIKLSVNLTSTILFIDSNPDSSSPSTPKSSSLCVTALSSSTTSSIYANSTWGAGSGSQSSSQGGGKVIVDGTDLEDWPTITGGAKLSSDGAGGGTREQECPGNNNNSSASWGERNIQQKEGAIGGGAGNMDNPSPPHFSPLSSSSSLNECSQSGGGVWVSSTSSQVEGGPGSAAFYSSKVSHLLPGPQEGPVGGSSSVSGANFNPNVNPSAWPALGQSGTSTSASNSLPLHSSITSASSFSASTTLVTTATLSSVNQTGLYQQHTETAVGAKSEEQQQHLGNPGLELGSSGGSSEAGPNQEGGSEENSEVVSDIEVSGNLSGISSSSSAASSSWRSMPPVSSELSIAASQADGWSGGTGGQGQEGNVWGFGSQDDKTRWGRGNNGESTTPVVSQGVWEGSSSEPDWGGSGEGASLSNLAIGSGRGIDGNSVSSSAVGVGIGGSSLEDSSSPKFATMTKAWDNQKGIESGDGVVGEWGGGGQGGGTGGGGPSSSSGGGSVAGSGGSGSGSGHKQERSSSDGNRSNQSNAEVALLSMLSRSDLDPKVLSNTGWGQTQIRQNVAWDLDTKTGVGNRNEINPSSSSAFSSATMNTTACRSPRYPSNTGSVSNDTSAGSHATSLNSGSATVGEGWDGGATQSARGPFVPGGTIRKPGSSEENLEGSQGKAAATGWGDPPPEKQGKGWTNEEQQWRDHKGGGRNWTEFEEQGTGWGDGAENKGTGGWKESAKGETSGWGGQCGGGGEWGQRDSNPGGGWGDGQNKGGSKSDEGSSWRTLDEGGSQRGGWGGGDVGGGKSHQDWGSAKPHAAAAQIPNSQVAPMKAPNQQQQQSQGQQPTGGPMQGGWNRQSSIGSGGPPSKNQNQSSGWTSGPIPQLSGGGSDSLEPSGWEEPSPQSISRKMEIDDGTSAWGDPTRYNNKNVNLWDRNSAAPGQSHSQQGPPPPMQQQPPRRQHSTNSNSGNGVVGKNKLCNYKYDTFVK